jgi:hypothetical protein
MTVLRIILPPPESPQSPTSCTMEAILHSATSTFSRAAALAARGGAQEGVALYDTDGGWLNLFAQELVSNAYYSTPGNEFSGVFRTARLRDTFGFVPEINVRTMAPDQSTIPAVVGSST